MSSRDRAAELRALADAHDVLAAHEDAAASAKDAYRAALDGGDEDEIAAAKAAHRAASQALNDARDAAQADVVVAPATPGSQTVMPQTVKAGG